MSNAPSDLLGLRTDLLGITGLSGAAIGIAADPRHLGNGGYHCGALDLKRINAVGNNDYSIRQSRDRARYNADVAAGRNDADAMDVGDNWPRGGRAAWLRFNNLLRAQLGANDPDLTAVRGINYTPNGTTRRRYDCLTDGESSSSDTVDSHTHIEWWRDTVGTQARALSIARIKAIAVAAVANTPLPGKSVAVTLKDGDMYLVRHKDANGALNPKMYATDCRGLLADLAAFGPVAQATHDALKAQGVAEFTFNNLADAKVFASLLAGPPVQVNVDEAAIAHAVAVELASDPSNPLTQDDVPAIAETVVGAFAKHLSRTPDA